MIFCLLSLAHCWLCLMLCIHQSEMCAAAAAATYIYSHLCIVNESKEFILFYSFYRIFFSFGEKCVGSHHFVFTHRKC
jgi:hypothetical protein